MYDIRGAVAGADSSCVAAAMVG
eukprot:COSAG06_NODE_58070_length_278_cov_0.581006_2_plen_22_part_01